METKFLRKIGHKRLHVWQEMLAKRPDMEVVRIDRNLAEEKVEPEKEENQPKLDQPKMDVVGWDLEGMSRPELVKFAAEKGISQPIKMKSVDLIEALREIENT